MRVHVIGCSGSFAGPAGAASSYLIEHEDADGRLWRVLMDLGSGAFGPLQNVIDPADLDAVIISHLHPDHYLDVTGLEVFWAYHSRTDLGKLPIHAPAPLPDRISAVLGRNGDIPDGVRTAPVREPRAQRPPPVLGRAVRDPDPRSAAPGGGLWLPDHRRRGHVRLLGGHRRLRGARRARGRRGPVPL